MLAGRVLGVGWRPGEGDEALTAETAVRVQTGLVLIFLAARSVHLGQAVIDLTIENGAYSRPWAADLLGVGCVVESAVLAAVALRSGRLSVGSLLGDAAFGAVGLAVMAAATNSTLDRGASLNWMLPYTVATAAGFGVVCAGDLRRRAPRGGPDGSRSPDDDDAGQPSRRRRALMCLGGLAAALSLAAAYVSAGLIPGLPAGQQLAQLLGNAANYPLFFAAALLLVLMLRRGLGIVARREVQASRAAAELAHAGQWRAVVVDVFGPALDLLHRVAVLDEPHVPAALRREADRLIAMIEAVNPREDALRAEVADSRRE